MKKNKRTKFFQRTPQNPVCVCSIIATNENAHRQYVGVVIGELLCANRVFCGVYVRDEAVHSQQAAIYDFRVFLWNNMECPARGISHCNHNETSNHKEADEHNARYSNFVPHTTEYAYSNWQLLCQEVVCFARECDLIFLLYDLSMSYTPMRPQTLGLTVFDNIPLTTLREFIDWTPFFLSWELRGKYPAIFDDAVVGEESRKLFAEANTLIDNIIANDSLRAKAVCGLFPANALDNDDVELYTDDTRTTVSATLHFLRQQSQKSATVPNLSLADFIAPKRTGIADYMGAFAVTAGIGTDELCKQYEAQNDDFSSIMVKAIADRFAEAAAEWLHAQVRTTLWGYAPDEQLTNELLIKEEYQGIRPAPGYPACPDHTEKGTLFDLLSVEKNTGMYLTESYAMFPAASVSGWYFAHPRAKYFPIGRISKDQVVDYATRKQMTVEETERWLAPSLSYDV